MNRCKDCPKWMHTGYCPIYAAWKAPLTRMCKWMTHERRNASAREYMRRRAAEKKGEVKQ